MRIFNSRFFTSATVAGAAFVLALSPFGLSVAQDEDLSISSVVPAAEVSIGAQFIDVDPNVKFDQAVLRVAGPDGYALTRTVSAEKGASYITADLLFDAEPARQGNVEEPLPWNHLPDGKYYFEIQFYSADGSTERQSGSFKVEGGTATPPNQNPLSANHSNGVIERIAGTVLDWLIPSAHAQSVESHGTTGDFDDFVSIRNQTGTGKSRLNLNTTDSIVINSDTWRIANDADSNRFEISEGGTTNRLVILQGGNVGIGTTAPLSPLHIDRTGGFQLRLVGSGADYRMDAFGTSLRIGHASNTNQFRIFEDAPFNSLVVRGDGVGIGTGSPVEALHVLRGNGTASILVEDTGSTSPLQMFSLKNNGSIRFTMANTTGHNWAFSTGSAGFSISRAGTGVELLVRNNGDVQIAGDVTANGVLLTSARETKTDFSPINEAELLDKIAHLDISQWRYKRDRATERHIGPMAEDFQEVFGLGDGKHISAGDANGILFAATKALKAENQNLRTELEEIRSRIDGIITTR